MDSFTVTLAMNVNAASYLDAADLMFDHLDSGELRTVMVTNDTTQRVVFVDELTSPA